MTNDQGLVAQERELSIPDIKTHIAKIDNLLKNVLKKDVHYGVIPGTKKPTLYKPGAEKICLMFQVACEYVVEDLSTDDMIRYRVRTKACHRGNGLFLGEGVGECSSNETKYKWRGAVCDEEFEETDENRRRKLWKKGYGNSKATSVKQVRSEFEDIGNTILKMAKKRSHIDMTINVLAASDVFDQDIEDLPDHMIKKSDNQPDVEMPTRKEESDSQLSCSDCQVIISQKVDEFSKSKYGRGLCMNCQKKA